MADEELLDYEGDHLEDEDSQKDKYISFTLGNEEYAIEIKYVMEIIGLQKITNLPDMPDFISGVINLRNIVYPIIDVRKRFKLPEVEHTTRTCIIIVNLETATVGLIVDQVSEVIDIPEENIDPLLKTHGHKSNRFIKGTGKIGDQVIIILEVNNILSEEEIDKLVSAV